MTQGANKNETESGRVMHRSPWPLTRLKFVASLRSGDSITADSIEDTGDYPVFGGNGLRGFTSRYTHDGDFVLIGRQGALCGNINYASGRFWASEHAVVVDTHGKANIRWLGELLRSLNLNQYSQSAAQPGLAVDVIANIEISVPPLAEQRAIADYLDRETGRIDRLVAAKERLLDLLAEKRSALIARAVIRGLDPNVEMKPSGVEWLGDIPEHWETRRIAFLFKERDDRETPDLPLLNVSLNTGVTVREFSDERIERTAADFATYKVARSGDVSFNKMRMWQGAVGIAPVDGLVSPDYVVAEPGPDVFPRYFGYLLRIPAFSAEAARRSHGIVWDRLRLYWDDFRDMRVPLPPLQEQETIVATLEAELTQADDLATALRDSIRLLGERRTALITAAVTGQVGLDDGGA